MGISWNYSDVHLTWTFRSKPSMMAVSGAGAGTASVSAPIDDEAAVAPKTEDASATTTCQPEQKQAAQGGGEQRQRFFFVKNDNNYFTARPVPPHSLSCRTCTPEMSNCQLF